MKYVTLFICLFSFAEAYAHDRDKHPLEGRWLLRMESSDIGVVRTVMTFETEGKNFSAYTRKNADRVILGFWKSGLARLFTKDFKGGSLFRVTGGQMERKGDTIVLLGIFRSAIGNYYFRGKLYNGVMTAQLTDAKENSRGELTGRKTGEAGPLADYPAIVSRAFELSREKIFDPSLTGEKAFRSFEKELRQRSKEMMDDVELVFAFFYYAQDLPFSHYNLLKLPEERVDKPAGNRDGNVHLEEKSPSVAYLKISSFGGSAREMDSIFSHIREKGYTDLIVDLRNNPGGSVEAGMAFATSVVDSSFYGGVFLTQKWFNNHNSIPQVDEYPSLPHFTEANYDLIIDGIHEKEGLCLKIIPAKHTYDGNLYILTNGHTASTCEPLVYGLQKEGRALVVGERTAGAMLNGEFFELPDGFRLIVPTADYYTADGYRIDQRGVKPDIEVEESEALDYVMEEIIRIVDR